MSAATYSDLGRQAVDDGHLSVAEKIGYGLGDAGGTIFTGLMTVFLTFFYTDIFGLSAAFVGTLFLLVRFIDALSDPLMGVLADRTRTKWGRFRPWQLWGAIPIGVVATAIFFTPDWGYGAKAIYAIVTYVLFSLCYTVVNVPYCALCGAMTRSDKAVVSAQAFRFAACGTAYLALTAGFPLLAAWFSDQFGGGDRRFGYPLAAAVYASLGAAMILVCFASVRERIAAPLHMASARKQILSALRNDQLRLMMFMAFTLICLMMVRGGSAMYLLERVMHASAGYTAAFLGVGGFTAILGAILAGLLSRRFAVERLFSIGNLILAAISLLFAAIPTTQMTAWFIAWAIMLGGANFLLPLLFSMITYVDDYGEWKLGERTSGINFGLALFAIKTSWAAGGAIIGFMLWVAAYTPNLSVQPPSAVAAIVALPTVIPALLHVVMWLLGRRFRLTASTRSQIVSELKARSVATPLQGGVALA